MDVAGQTGAPRRRPRKKNTFGLTVTDAAKKLAAGEYPATLNVRDAYNEANRPVKVRLVVLKR